MRNGGTSASRWTVTFSDHCWGEVRYYEERAERRHTHREKTKHAEPLTTCHHLIHNTTNNTSDVRFYKGRAIHEAGGHAAALPDSRPATATTLLSLSSPQLFLLFAIIRPLSSPCAPLWSSAPPLRQAGWSAQRCRPSVWCQESHTGSSEDKKKKKERKKTRCEAVPNARHAGVCTPCDECSQRWNTGTTSLRWEARTPRSGWVWEGRRQWQGEGDNVFFFFCQEGWEILLPQLISLMRSAACAYRCVDDITGEEKCRGFLSPERK